MTEFCTNCGTMCCGRKKFRIEVRKGSYKSFCNDCFGLFFYLKPKEIRRKLKLNKDVVTT